MGDDAFAGITASNGYSAVPVPALSPRSAAAVQALAVCFVWSTSFVVTKQLYVHDIGPLTLSGLRYGIAALALLPVVLLHRAARAGPAPGGFPIRVAVVLGVLGYGLNPIGQHIGLDRLDASAVVVLLAVGNSLQVLLWSALLLRERPGAVQLGAIAVATGGIVAFGWPAGGTVFDAVGVAAVLAGGTGYALWIVGNRSLVHRVRVVDLTCWSMLCGAVPTLGIGLAAEGVPRLPASGWLLVVLLGVVNTALAFAVWTRTQRVLAPYESSTINNTMTVQVAVLAVVFLGEVLTAWQWAALAVVTVATLVVSRAGGRRDRA